MKKLLLLVMSAFCLGACSVNTLEMEAVDSELLVLDATYTVDGCSVTTFNYGNSGRIEVRNDRDFIYVKLIANGDFEIAQSNLHLAANISGFPTTGNAKNPGINIGNMDNRTVFIPNVKEYNYKFPVNSFGDSFLVGAYTIFQVGNKKYNLWAGDISGNGWSYFLYNINEHPYNAGGDNFTEMGLNEVKSIKNERDVKSIYVNMLDPQVNFTTGTFNPTIWDLINRFNNPSIGGVGEYSTVYTIGEGECKDSVILTLIVIPDEIK